MSTSSPARDMRPLYARKGREKVVRRGGGGEAGVYYEVAAKTLMRGAEEELF